MEALGRKKRRLPFGDRWYATSSVKVCAGQARGRTHVAI
jgi:hypothetical protein